MPANRRNAEVFAAVNRLFVSQVVMACLKSEADAANCERVYSVLIRGLN